MSITLGLDIGSKSIGWALLDELKEQIIATGVRVFPEGVNRTQQGTEESKNMGRRTARSIRRQIARRARRKKLVSKILIEAKLLPVSHEERIELFKKDPYILRKKALDEKLSAFELGRIFLNLAQRRGFKSNRKTDKLKEKENSEMLQEISSLEKEVQSSGSRTLGEYLAGFRIMDPLAKIRSRHTRRDMFEKEFELIWDCQSKHHGELDNNLHLKIQNAIFFQRKMYWDKKTIGKCSLEPNLPRASVKDRVVQLARLYQEVNNFQIIEADGEIRHLKDMEREQLIAYLSDSKERKFEDIKKKMKWINCEFNLAAGGREKLIGLPVDKEMEGKKLFGKGWKEKSEEEKTRIVRQIILFQSRDEEDPVKEQEKEKIFCHKAIHEWGIPSENLEYLLGFDPGSGRASFCFKALDKLLPFLRRGLPMMAEDGRPSAFSEAGYQRPDQKAPNQKATLPPPPSDITNPIVKQGLNEVRALINAIIREYGLPDEIHVELAREARGNRVQREQLTINQRKNEKVREEARERISENDLIPGRGSIEFYRLWKDQDGICIYSGKPISLKQLLGGEVNVDHIWPFSRCLDDSLSNKVVCLRDENNAKANMTPREWLEKSNPQKWEEVLQRVRKLPYPARVKKLERFLAREVKLDDFINRELTDTAYISRQVTSYIRCLGTKVVCNRGGVTAELRHQWGLNGILNPDKENQKTREDHRHHAVDALVIAATNPSRLQALSKRRRNISVNPPWENFRTQAEDKVLAIWVSHKPCRRVRGQLHEETIYGATQKNLHPTNQCRPWAKDWKEENGVYCYRKPLESLTFDMVKNIRDDKIREIVLKRLIEVGFNPDTDNKIPKEAWEKPLTLSVKSKGSIIKKVRILRNEKSIVPLRVGNSKVFVKPGNTHHISIFETLDKNNKSIKFMETITMIDAYLRKKKKQPIFQRLAKDGSNSKFIMTLCAGDMVLLKHKDKEILCKYVTSASTQGQIYFSNHSDARPSSKAEKIVKNANTLNGSKVTVDILGRLRNAGD